jgi:Sap, sulfolipid-1-addressing protein
MTLGEYLLLAFASIFWPLLMAIVVVALRTQHPVRVLTAFLAGGLLATISIGCALVFWLEGVSGFTGERPPADPWVYMVCGGLALVAAIATNGLDRRAPPPHEAGRTARWKERLVGNGRLAFLAGVVLNIVPGFFPFVALKDIAATSFPAATKVVLVVVFYLIMFAFVEVPLVCYLVAPSRTAAAVLSFNDWLDRNGRRLAVWLLGLVGVYLVVRGLTLL